MATYYWCPRCSARTHELSEGERIGYMCMRTGLDIDEPLIEEEAEINLNGSER